MSGIRWGLRIPTGPSSGLPRLSAHTIEYLTRVILSYSTINVFFYTGCDHISFISKCLSGCPSTRYLRWRHLFRGIKVGLTASCHDHTCAAGTSQTNCGRFPRMQGCPSRASLASANMRRGQTAWSPCSGISRTPTLGYSSLSSSCQERRQCMVRIS